MKRIVLYGAGGLGRETAYLIDLINYNFPGTYWFLGFIEDKAYYKPNKVVNGYPVLGTEEWLLANKDVACVCTIANVCTRQRIQESLSAQGIEFETLIAPYTPMPPSTTIGKGCVIFGGCAISVNCRIGDGIFLNTRVSIGHDVIMDNYTSVMPGCSISGNCHIGENVNIGGHAFIVPGKTIGDGAVVAAGSVVFRNVKAGTTVLGNPALRVQALESPKDELFINL